MYFRGQKKSAQDVSLSDYIETGTDGAALSLMDVVSEDGEENAEVEALIRARADAKKAKNFAEADRIRDELKAQGIELADIPNGAKWKRV